MCFLFQMRTVCLFILSTVFSNTMTKDFLITLDEEKESHAGEEKVNNDKEIEEKEVKMAKEIELKATETIGNKMSRFSSDYHFSYKPTKRMGFVTFLGPGGTWWECLYDKGKR